MTPGHTQHVGMLCLLLHTMHLFEQLRFMIWGCTAVHLHEVFWCLKQANNVHCLLSDSDLGGLWAG